MSQLLRALDDRLAPKSEVHILSNWSLEEREKDLNEAGFKAPNLSLHHHFGPGTRINLEKLPLTRATAVITREHDSLKILTLTLILSLPHVRSLSIPRLI